MKQLILLAGAVALASAGAASAKPPHAGHGKPPHAHHGAQGKGHPLRILNNHAPGYGVGGCPPGLQNKGCMPPGLARQQFRLGQRIPFGYGGLLGYDRLPQHLRTYYGPQLDPYSRYIYDDSYLYRVDPRTLMVQQILSAVLRPY